MASASWALIAQQAKPPNLAVLSPTALKLDQFAGHFSSFHTWTHGIGRVACIAAPTAVRPGAKTWDEIVGRIGIY